MYRSGLTIQATDAPSVEDDNRARRRLTLLYVGSLVATIVILITRGAIVQLSTEKVSTANTIAALIIAPPLIYWAFRVVSKGFQSCQAATNSDDPAVKEAAIAHGLGLPAQATKAYLIAWIVGQPLAFLVTVAITPLRTEEITSYVTDFIGFIPVAGFPIYAVVESQMRPVLRTLYRQTAGSETRNDNLPKRFGIPMRVSLAMGSLVLAMIMFLEGKVIANAFGANVPYHDEMDVVLLQVPVFLLLVGMVGAAVVSSLRGSIDEVIAQVRASADGDLRQTGAVTSTDELGALMVDIDRMLARQAVLIKSSRTWPARSR